MILALFFFKSLARLEIPVRMFDELSDDERQEIELEENLQRKDLTPYERSRVLVKLVDTASKVLKSESELFDVEAYKQATEFSPIVGKNPKGGRPQKPDAERKVAERIGVPQQTINIAKQHVAAVERYPALSTIPTQKDACSPCH